MPKIQGILKTRFDKKSGTGKNGAWESEKIIIETLGEYPERCLIECFNKTEMLNKFAIGTPVSVQYKTDVTEWEGKFYGKNQAWKIEPIQISQSGEVKHETPAAPANAPEKPANENPFATENNESDLPF